ncbi:MAG: glycine cleavage system protein GcvH [Candidatus Accumulibacter sp.]|nr:glycine cleavage system protein GcvH [Accumulibacter sp.]
MTLPSQLKYTATHEWIRKEADGTLTVGITEHAQDLLGDLVFVELPAVGKALAKDQEAAIVESVKAASDVYAPLAGVVVEVNAPLVKSPELINQDAYAAWLFKLKPDNDADYDALLDAAAYEKACQE